MALQLSPATENVPQPFAGKFHSRKLMDSVNAGNWSIGGEMAHPGPEKAMKNGLTKNPPSFSNPIHNKQDFP